MTTRENRRRKQDQHSRYTFRQTWKADGGLLTMCNDQLRYVIATVLAKVPKDVADRTYEGCMFCMPEPDDRGILIPEKLLRHKCLIVFPESLLDEDEAVAEHVVLHEIAHFYLGHNSQIDAGVTDEQMDRQEDEADRTADMWLRDTPSECA
jgi:hypothetical protein